MPPVDLTENAIALLSSDAEAIENPVLQVVDIRLVVTQKQTSNTERYRMLLSDGLFTQQGMLATQHNDLVRSKKLKNGSIVQLNRFVCNPIQNRKIIIVIDLDVIVENCDIIGDPKQYHANTNENFSSNARTPMTGPTMNQPAAGSGNPQFYGNGSGGRPNVGGGLNAARPGEVRNVGLHSYGGASFSSNNMDSVRYNSLNTPQQYPKTEIDRGFSRPPTNNNIRPQYLHHQPPPEYVNRGPIAKNEAAPRVIPIAALNPYQGRWTIKARVTAKGELRLYNNARGDGKVFSFDLLDSDGGEIRVTCFNAVADQFYHQIEPGRVYMFSKGILKPAQKTYNHLRNDLEIMLDTTSTVQPCFEEDNSIPAQQFHFRPISDIEGLESNSIVDVIGVVSSINPATSIMRKNGTETHKRSLQLMDMSGRSVELTLWGNFCLAEGQTLQSLCDSGIFPILAVKSGRVNDFNGKSVGTLSTSQIFIQPDFPESQKLKTWFDNEGKHTPAKSISRDPNFVRTDERKTISQIKEEKLGTSEKPDWITVSATLTFIKGDNFCYTACPLMIGDRQCNKKVTNNGDGKWQCDRCERLIDECDYRYILQMQIQDHTGLTWVTAFQESGEEIMGLSAKSLYCLKHEEQEDEKFAELVRGVLFTQFAFKLKVKEEMFSDEQRVKSTVVKAERIDARTYTRYLLDAIAKFKEQDSTPLQPKSGNHMPSSGVSNVGSVNAVREYSTPAMNYSGISNSRMSSDNQYGSPMVPKTGSTGGTYTSCTSCGGTGHNNANCPSLINVPTQSYVNGPINKMAPGSNAGECFKCHQSGHWSRDCPGTSNRIPPAYGSNAGPNAGSNARECFKCHQAGHWARDCPGTYVGGF